MVEADYPNSPFMVGDVLELSDTTTLNGQTVYYKKYPPIHLEVDMLNKYPKIFRPMHWSEQRGFGEMPRYVNRKGVIKKVLDPKYDNRIFGHNEHEIEMRTLLHGIKYWKESYTPATEAEYLEYLKSKGEMKTITINNRTLLFVEVPETAHHFSIEQVYLTWLNVSDSEDVLAQLPSGNYRFIATTDTINEEQADKIVDKSAYSRMLYLNYQFGGVNEYALDSFKSLLKHHSITGRHAIIEVLH